MSKIIITIFLLLGIFTTVRAEETVNHEAVADTSDCAAGWLWEISGNGLQKKSYLFGTCHGDGHSFTKEEVFGIAGVEHAFDSVEAVFFEMAMNPDKQDDTDIKEYNEKLMEWIKNPGPKYRMPEGVYYKRLYDSVAHFNEVNKFLTYQMKDAEYWKKTPNYWFSILKIVMFAGTRKAKTVDDVMYEETVKRGYKNGGLEVLGNISNSLDTLFMKNDFLDKLSLKEKADTLYRFIQFMNNGQQNSVLDEFTKAYLTNDTCEMHSLVEEMEIMLDDGDKYDTLMLRDRNRKWIPVMEQNMALCPCMIAVGCRHLLGFDGLIAMLRREGYSVEPVK